MPCPISRPAAKMPIRSQTDWTWFRRWLDRRIAIWRSLDEAPEELEDLGDAERVDRRGRLVEDQDVGILDQRVGDAEALEHAPRVLLGLVVGPGRQADLLERLVDRRIRLGLRDPVQAGRVAQVLAPGQVRVEADRVREVADAALDLERAAGRVEPDDAGLALGRLGQPEEHQDRRRLAGAVLAEQAEDLAGLDLEIEMVDGDEVAVGLGQAAGPDRGARPVVASRGRGAPGRDRDRQRAAGRPSCGSAGWRAPSSPPVGPEDVEQADEDRPTIRPSPARSQSGDVSTVNVIGRSPFAADAPAAASVAALIVTL